jgi:hypothetical protein
MLGSGRYLLGVAELAVLVGFATLGAAGVRSRLLPRLAGPPAWLASAVFAAAILIWVAEALGSFGLFKSLPYLLGVVVVGLGGWALGRRSAPRSLSAPGRALLRRRAPMAEASPSTASAGAPHGGDIGGRSATFSALTVVSALVVLVAVVRFAAGVRLRLSTGMTGFDSTWYHGPLAVEFFQTANTFDLHFIAPQYLAWFYPDNAEIFHAVGMVAFSRDILSPLINFGWFSGCLLAAWCIGRAYRVGPASLALVAIALSVPVLGDQAGEARNDLVGIFFLLAAVAIAVSVWEARSDRRLSSGALVVVGLAAGLAAGTKLNFVPAAVVLVIGLVVIAPRGARWRALLAAGLPALAGGGYWYLRNLVKAGNPLPWVRHLGPISLPAPAQPLGGREAHSVFGYLTDGSAWSHWFLPGLHQGLWIVWPLLGGLALAGLLLCLGRGASPLLRLFGVVGLVAALTWLLAPTSAEGPAGMPRGFESALRYLAPALILGMALLAIAPPLRERLRRWAALGPRRRWAPPAWAPPALGALLLAALVFGYREQRNYLQHRYAHPSFTTQGLDAAFRWARSISGARIATTSTRLYPLFGTELSNHVQYVGIERPHGGFVAPTTCRSWRRLIDAGHYNYVIASRDRIEAGRPAYPSAAQWTEAPGATVILRRPPTVVFHLTAPLDPSSCPSD